MVAVTAGLVAAGDDVSSDVRGWLNLLEERERKEGKKERKREREKKEREKKEREKKEREKKEREKKERKREREKEREREEREREREKEREITKPTAGGLANALASLCATVTLDARPRSPACPTPPA